MLNINEEEKVKKLISLSLMLMIVVMAMPAYAAIHDTVVKNVETAGGNLTVGLDEVMDNTHEQASKGKTVVGQVGGLAVGSVHAARNTLYKAGAGAIDLLTFWIPKQQPLIKEKA